MVLQLALSLKYIYFLCIKHSSKPTDLSSLEAMRAIMARQQMILNFLVPATTKRFLYLVTYNDDSVFQLIIDLDTGLHDKKPTGIFSTIVEKKLVVSV